MRIRVLLFFLIALLWFFPASPADSAPRRKAARGSDTSSFGLLFGYLQGHTTYHISDYGFNPPTNTIEGIESELEFPLDVFLFGLEGGIGTKDRGGRDAFQVRFSWITTLGDGKGKMKDSDWATDGVDNVLAGAPNPGLDIYSESDISLSGNILELRANHNFWLSGGFALGPLAGYRYEKFSYDVSNLRQVGFGPYAASFSGSFAGKVLDYEVIYHLPYVGLHAVAFGGKSFRAALDVGYSFWATAEDRDDHVLRTKLATGDTSGKAYLAELDLIWDLGDNDYLTVRQEFLKIDTSGTQTQRWYGNADAPSAVAGDFITGIDDKITSKQISAILLFTHRF